MHASGLFQAKLKIGQHGDKYEQEADRVAKDVVSKPGASVARQVDEDQEAQRPEELARDQQDALITARKIKQDLKDYWSERHVTKVVGPPKKALVYSTVIKVISMFVALIFPFIGYGAFFGSVYLIDRGMWLRHEEYLNNLVRSITWLNAVVTFFQQLFAPTIPVPPAPAAAETTVTG